MINKYINFPVFLISLALGLLHVYLYRPTSSTVYVYPTPDNVNDVLYKDKANNCYKFTPTEVSCDKQKEISEIPFQG